MSRPRSFLFIVTYVLCWILIHCSVVIQATPTTMGIVLPISCPIGFYCPAHSSKPIACPLGTFSNRTGLSNLTECSLCPPGHFCNETGLSTQSGTCSEGYYCTSGAVDFRGTIGPLGGEGGVCPGGHYCPLGSARPIPCPIGTFNIQTGRYSIDQCLPCTPGYFCESLGVLSPTGMCSEGYYCKGGDNSSRPSNNICPIGHYCAVGSSFPQPCIDGAYQNATGQSICKICPSGYYCTNALIPQLCPEKYYCPEGTGFPQYCPNGTYGDDLGFKSSSECKSCPSGKYCQGGMVKGDCLAGFICYGGNFLPHPTGLLPNGDLCPKGFYCPEGTSTPTPCRNGTAGLITGGVDESVCGTCPAGYYCLELITDPIPCPPGHYCLEMSTGPIGCPISTYQPNEKASDLSACLPCKAGFYCPLRGMPQPYNFPCPIGHYCEEGSTIPLPCPISTFNNDTRSTSVEYCEQCTGGYYCNETALLEPVECSAKHYCPRGSSNQVLCPISHYCPPRTEIPILCPAGYFCPLGSDYPIHCDDLGYYCPEGTDFPILCPLGYQTTNQTSSRASISDSCSICPAGTYGNHSTRYYCEECESGYICFEGATSGRPHTPEERGYICPIGYYCPSGTIQPTACLPGTFGATVGLGSPKSCSNCSENSFQDLAGQTSCLPCGSSSYSTPGSTTCTCYGLNRVFQKSDRSCICSIGHVFYIDNRRSSEADGDIDCQPIVYDRCKSGFTRNSNGNCVSDRVCDNSCGSVGGRVAIETGLCECNNIVDENEICDEVCRRNQLKVLFNSQSHMLEVYDPVSSSVVRSFDFYSVSSGNLNCVEDQCRFQLIQMNENGFKGLYSPSTGYLDSLLSGANFSAVTSRRVHEVPQGIDQPAVCLVSGQGLLFDLSAGKDHYPVYQKDSLVNTNKNFDYGDFRRLADMMKSNLTIHTFSFVFHEPGIYLFVDNADRNKNSIVRVLPADQECPSAVFRPITSSNLVTLGVSKTSDILLTPDWLLVGVLLLSAFVFVGVLILAVHFFRTRSWHISSAFKPKYKKLLPIDESDIRSEDLLSHRKLFSSGGPNSELRVGIDELVDLEGFNVKVFYDKLTQFSQGIIDNVQGHGSQAVDLYKRIHNQFESIRELLRNNHFFGEIPYHQQFLVLLQSLKNMSESKVVDPGTENAEIRSNFELLRQKLDLVKGEFNNELGETTAFNSILHQLNEAEKDVIHCETLYRDGSIPLEDFQKQLKENYTKIREVMDELDTKFAERKPLVSSSNKNDITSILKEYLESAVSDLVHTHRRDLPFPVIPMVAEEYDDVLFDDGRYSDDDSDIVPSKNMETRSMRSKASVRIDREEVFDDTLDESDDHEPDNLDPDVRRSQVLEQKIKRKAKQLRLSQRNDLQELNDSVLEEFENEKKKISHAIAAIREDRLNEMKRKLEDAKKQLDKDPDLKAEQKKGVLEALYAEMDEYNIFMDKEKRAQEELLKQILEEKRRKKRDLLKRKHDEELRIQQEEFVFHKNKLADILGEMSAHKDDRDKNVALELTRQKNMIEQQLIESERRRQEKQQKQKELLERILKEENGIETQTNKDKELLDSNLINLQKRVLDEQIKSEQQPDKKNQVIADYERKLDQFKKLIEEDKEKRESEAEQRMESKKHSNTIQLQSAQALEEQEDIEEQKKELDQLRNIMRNFNDNSDNLLQAVSKEKERQEREVQEKLELLKVVQNKKNEQRVIEQKQLEDELEKEKRRQQEEIEKQIEIEMKNKLQAQEATMNREIQDQSMRDHQKKEIMDNYEQSKQNLELQMNNVKQVQLEELERKMEEKKKILTEKLRREHQDQIQKELSEAEAQINQITPTNSTLDETIPLVSISIEGDEEQKELRRANQIELELFRQKQQEDVKKEMSRIKQEMEQKLEKRKEMLLQSQNTKLKELEDAKQKQSEESNEFKRQQIIDDYERNKTLFEKSVHMEAMKQDNDFSMLLEAAKQKMLLKNSNALLQKKREQDKKEEELRSAHVVQAERKALLDIITNNSVPVRCVSDAVDVVVIPRMNQQINELPNKYAKYKKDQVQIISERYKKKLQQLQDLHDQYDKEGNVQEAKAIQEQINATEKQEHDEVNLAMKELDLQMTQERIELKAKHLAQKNNFCKEFEQYEVLLEDRLEENKKIKDAIESFAKQIEDQREENRLKIEDQKKKIQEELEAQYQKEIDHETAKIKEQIEKERNKLTVQELIAEREQEVKQLLEQQKNLEKDQREKILAQHKIDMTRFEEALEDERERQDEYLKKRIDEVLAEKMRKKKQKGEEKINNMFSSSRDLLSDSKKKSLATRALNRWQAQVTDEPMPAQLRSSMNSITVPTTSLSPPPRVSSRTSMMSSATNNILSKNSSFERSWFAMLLRSPLYAKLHNIERLLLALQKGGYFDGLDTEFHMKLNDLESNKSEQAIY